MSYPPELQKIVEFFQSLSEDERRENLIAYARRTARHEPQAGEQFLVVDDRKDEECTDRVAVFVQLDGGRRARLRMKLGSQVQTLTRAMAVILCEGLDRCRPQEIISLTPDFVPRIVGAELIRVRSRTVYYVLSRMKTACGAALASVGELDDHRS